jgi:formylglycine-generating enzyme required for sulfatase activity
MSSQIFISYSRADKEFVDRLARDLIENGIDVWVDRSNIRGGDRWRQRITDGISSSELVVVVLSPKSLHSEYVERELCMAANHRKPLIPVHCQPVDTLGTPLEFYLSGLQYISFDQGSYDQNLNHLLAAITKIGLSFQQNRVGKELGESETTPLPRQKLRWGAILGFVAVLMLLFVLGVFLLVGDVDSLPLGLLPPSTPTQTSSVTPTKVKPTLTRTPSPTVTASKTVTASPSVTASPTPTPDLSLIEDEHGIPMILIPEGPFVMGSDSDRLEFAPAHQVWLPNFYIDKYEVTNANYAACVDAGECAPPNIPNSKTRPQYFGNPEFDDYPVIFVRWDSAETYCKWRGVRLPTEAEWEKAARGTDERLYPWGEQPPDCSRANYWPTGPCLGDTAEVGTHPRGVSPYGVHDLTGNVWEWVQDWYNAYPGGDPEADELFDGTHRVLRGGSFLNTATYLRSFVRKPFKPYMRGSSIGFRCARDFEP